MPPNTEYQVTDATRFGQVSVLSDGQGARPSYAFASESSLGFYRAGAGVVGVSGGLAVAASGYTGTAVRALSFVTAVVPVHVVQGSASSFTVLVWPAARAGDVIVNSLLPNAGVSSLSSGLVMHSHCTADGRVEFRYSNVSTLVQNQSAQTVGFLRLSAF